MVEQDDVKPVVQRLRVMDLAPPEQRRVDDQERIEILSDDDDEDLWNMKLRKITFDHDVKFLQSVQSQLTASTQSNSPSQIMDLTQNVAVNNQRTRPVMQRRAPAAPMKPAPPAEKPLCSPSPSKRRRLHY